MLKTSLITCLLVAILCVPAAGSTRLKNICRIKGQEENTIRGLGLVVGLAGTGETNDGPTMRAIERALAFMGSPVANDGQQINLDELRKIKNAALVIVTATIPATGARYGDRINCHVSALNGKSLAGGRLAFASLLGPNTQSPVVFGTCEGQVLIDDPALPTVGVVNGGCQMKMDVFTPFYLNGYITLVLEQNHANFQTAAFIAKEIERKFGEYESGDSPQNMPMVYAKDAANIIVRIPETYADDPVDFASDILDIRIEDHEPESRVVINSRAGSIVISGDMEIGDVIVSHKNIAVEVEAGETFSPLGADESTQPRLKQLVDQLNLLRIPTEDMIEIIRGIERNGKLHGRLIIE